jgi:hypothetical protein
VFTTQKNLIFCGQKFGTTKKSMGKLKEGHFWTFLAPLSPKLSSVLPQKFSFSGNQI